MSLCTHLVPSIEGAFVRCWPCRSWEATGYTCAQSHAMLLSLPDLVSTRCNRKWPAEGIVGPSRAFTPHPGRSAGKDYVLKER